MKETDVAGNCGLGLLFNFSDMVYLICIRMFAVRRDGALSDVS